MKHSNRSIKTLFHNLSFLSRTDIRGLLREDYKQLQFQSSLACMLANSVDIKNDEEKNSAIEYVKSTGRFDMIPYPLTKEGIKVSSGIDQTSNLPFVIHNSKRLYFPSSWTQEQTISMYRHFIENEQLTGEHFREHAPHCYISEDFRIEPEDVLIDTGCAEGILSLSFIHKIKHTYLVENSPEWFEPIETSFRDYLGKNATLIRKTIGCCDSKDTITLQKIIEDDSRQSFFVKMDIEGAEIEVLESSIDYLRKTRKKIKLAVCCYHRQTDTARLEAIMKKIGYSYSFSDGYILAPFFDPTGTFSLRRGVIRAQNNF